MHALHMTESDKCDASAIAPILIFGSGVFYLLVLCVALCRGFYRRCYLLWCMDNLENEANDRKSTNHDTHDTHSNNISIYFFRLYNRILCVQYFLFVFRVFDDLRCGFCIDSWVNKQKPRAKMRYFFSVHLRISKAITIDSVVHRKIYLKANWRKQCMKQKKNLCMSSPALIIPYRRSVLATRRMSTSDQKKNWNIIQLNIVLNSSFVICCLFFI